MKKIGRNTVVVLGIGLFVTIAYLMYVRSLVGREAERMNRVYWEKAGEDRKAEKTELHKVPGYAELLKRKGELEAGVKMAASDSIGLLLDVPGRMAHLMIKGVCVREIPLEKIGLPSFLRKIDEEVLYDWMARPMKIVSSRATIPKEPIRVVEAPRDTLDVIPQIEPDTAHIEPVFFVLNTDRRFRYYFYQTAGRWTDGFTGFAFGGQERWKMLKKTLKGEYEPEIRIGVSKENAKVLYRALPVRGWIVLTL